jgi:hypothetical protein
MTKTAVMSEDLYPPIDPFDSGLLKVAYGNVSKRSEDISDLRRGLCPGRHGELRLRSPMLKRTQHTRDNGLEPPSAVAGKSAVDSGIRGPRRSPVDEANALGA